MANYADIINSFEAIATSRADIEFFIYNRVSSLNGRVRDKAYPLILVSSTPNTNRGDFNGSYLPRNKTYTFNIFCYDLFNRSDQKTKSLQEAQAEVDSILDRYIAQFARVNQAGVAGFELVNIQNINGFLAHDVHNDKLVQSTYTVTVRLDSDCIE